jgi:hypothetical protein
VFVEQLELDAAGARAATLKAALRALALEPEGVGFRLFRDTAAPGRALLLATWAKREQVGRAQRLAEGTPLAGMRVRAREDFTLLDMAWGRVSRRFHARGIHADHISASVAPGKWDLWRPYARNFVSVMARQAGFVAHEMLRSHTDPLRFAVLRSFVSPQAARVGPEFDPPEEVRLATEPGEARGVYAGTPPPRYRMLELRAAAWGPAGRRAYEQYVGQLESV